MTRNFIIGDHLVTPQPEGHHHGLFVGHDQVIHCLPPPHVQNLKRQAN